MEENEQNDNGNSGRRNSSIAKFTGMAFQMIAIIGVFAFIGYKIDQSANHTTKWCTAIFSLAGVLIAMYVVIKSLKD
jgi:F0F1-type ATP synthase assembly protein I